MATQAGTTDIAEPRRPSADFGGTERVKWVDTARGLAILLVVFGHAAGGLIDSAGPGSLPSLRYLFLAIYTFHMPIFFFLSALFVEQRMEKGIPKFVSRLLTTLVYAYFLWSIVQYSLIFALGSLVNHPANNYWETVLALPWSPVSQFWFLHALFLIHLLGIVAWRLGGRWAVIGIALLVKLVALWVPSTPALSLAASNAPYYALGFLLGWKRVSSLLALASTELRGLVVLCAGAALVLFCSQADAIQPFVTVETASSASIAKVAWLPAMLPATLLGAAALMLIAEGLSRKAGLIAGLTGYLGTMTMPIFILHIIFIAGTRIIFAKVFGLSGIAVLPLLLAAGVLGPLLVRFATDRVGLTRILALR